MDTEFLRTVLPDNDGFFYTVRMEEPSKGQNFPRHTACHVRKQNKAQWLDEKYGHDHALFFTPFTFKTDYLPNENGDKRNVRKHDDQKLECQCLWMDVDIGKGDGTYPDAKTALGELFNRCDNTVMPKPTRIVNSGGGFHLYWVLEKPLALDEWNLAAGKFKQWWLDSGYLFDAQCTTDSARFLRLPGTYNRKQETPRQCKQLDWNEGYLSLLYIPLWPEAVSTVETIPQIKAFHTATEENLGTSHKVPKYTKDVVSKCAVFRRVHADNGASCDEPLWKDILQTVELTEDADEWAHELSRGHKDYSFEGTEAKRSERTHGKAIMCSTYGAHFTDDPCEGCPLKGQGHSPLWEAPQVIEASTGQPRDVEVRANGTYKMVPSPKQDEPDIPVQVTSSRILEVKLQRERLEGINCLTLVVTHDTGGKIQTESAVKADLSGPKFTVALDHLGLSWSNSKKAGELKEVLMSWASSLRTAGTEAEVYTKQGWVVRGGEVTGFSLDGAMYQTDGQVIPADPDMLPTPAAMPFRAVGSIEPWKEAAREVVESGNPDMVSMVAASFGAPLAHMLGSSGACATLSYYSKDSGVGKTTTLCVARAIWARPDSYLSPQDTYAFNDGSIKAQPNLALMWDDPKTERARRDVMSLVRQMTSLKTKGRGRADGSIVAGEDIHSILILTANTALAGEIDKEAGDAEGKRFLEITVPKLQLPVQKDVFQQLDTNYGHAGPIFIQHVTRHYAKVQQRLRDKNREVSAALGDYNPERFYVNTIAAALVGAEIATELGLVTFDIPALFEKFKDHVTQARSAVAEAAVFNSPESDLRRFLTDERVYGGVVHSFPRKGMTLGDNNVISPPKVGQEKWHWVKEDSSGTFRIMRSEFAAWYRRAHDRDWNAPGWLDRAGDMVVDKNRQVSLRVGTARHHTFTGSHNVRCMVLRLADEINTESGELTVVSSVEAPPPAAEG